MTTQKAAPPGESAAATSDGKEETLSKLNDLQKRVDLILKEFDMATAFHEAWKPMHFDSELHTRMGKSFSTNTFNVIASALRREMILALVRIWDKTRGTVNLEAMIHELRITKTRLEIEKFRFGNTLIEREMAAAWNGLREELIMLADNYLKEDAGIKSLQSIRRLRHEQLAHTQVAEPEALSISVDQIETLYQDTARIVELLLSVVKGVGYDTDDTAKSLRRHAGIFWAGVRGELTEGHPHFRPPPIRPCFNKNGDVPSPSDLNSPVPDADR